MARVVSRILLIKMMRMVMMIMIMMRMRMMMIIIIIFMFIMMAMRGVKYFPDKNGIPDDDNKVKKIIVL